MTLRNEDTRTARVAVVAAALFVLAGLLGRCGAEPSPALAQAPGRPRWSHTSALMLAQAAVHEADWRALGDLGGIFQVVTNRRHEGETFAAALRRVMPNLAAGNTGRAWVLGLPVGPIHHSPPGWPWRLPAAHFSQDWMRLHDHAVSLLTGTQAPPCEGYPTRWFGRVCDRARLETALESGMWVEVPCGGTANAFLSAIDPD